MIKSLFLEFKFGQIDLDLLRSVNFNHLIVGFGHLVPEDYAREQWSDLKKLGVKMGISRIAFDYGGCPADPSARKKLLTRVEEALSFNPDEIWLDHFRFDGHWEMIEGRHIPDLHLACRWCQKVNDRSDFITRIAEEIRDKVRDRAKVGYFAVPFKSEEVPQLIGSLGQDHHHLREVFDLCSPMIYHRMIGRSVDYIAEYVNYLQQQLTKPILPIVQVKDMPDDRLDDLSAEEIRREFTAAVSPPSLGVCFFSWDHAVEKGKTGVVRELFGS